MVIKNKDELNTLRECGKRLAKILENVVHTARHGVTTEELDRLAESLILSEGGEPIFKGYKVSGARRPYPGSLCVSINDEIVHGIPSDQRTICEGDVVGLDIGMRWPGKKFRIQNSEFRNTEGLVTDMAVTIGVGKISQKAEKLIRATKESLDIAILMLKPGVKLGDFGYAIQKRLEKNGLGVIRDLAGHGVGKELHEDPMIPNYGKKGTGPKLVEGQVVAVEPMASLGGWNIKTDDDGWAIRMADGSLAAHFEHTVVITKESAEVLTRLENQA